MKYEVLLNCEGINDTDDPSMLPRCQNCVGHGPGTFRLTGKWLTAYIELYNDELSTNELFDKLNGANLIPSCPRTGAKRFATTSVSSHK